MKNRTRLAEMQSRTGPVFADNQSEMQRIRKVWESGRIASMIFKCASPALNFHPQHYDGPFAESYGYRVHLDKRSYKFYTFGQTWSDAEDVCEFVSVIDSEAEEEVRFININVKSI